MSIAMIMCSPPNNTGIPYTRPLLEIEKNFDNCGYFTLLSDNWKIIYVFISVYLAAIFLGREYMKTRPPYQLRGALLFWNIALATFSIVSTWRSVPAAYTIITTNGLYRSSCTTGSLEERQSCGLWVFLFIVSKVVEFGDTAFIVLRKQNLLFLHWYHHLTSAFFVWSAGAYASPMQAYFSTLNVFVHSIMYSYYALKVLRINVPKIFSLAITFMQLVQMGLGVYITWYMYRAKLTDPSCLVQYEGLIIAMWIYASYFVLFLNFFIRNYLMSKKPTAAGSVTWKKLM